MTITAEQWNDRRRRGLTAVVREKAYIVMMHSVTHEPVYQSVAIRQSDTARK